MAELAAKVADHYGYRYEWLVGRAGVQHWPKHLYSIGIVRGTLYAFLRYELGYHATEIADFFGRHRTTIITVGDKYEFLKTRDVDVRGIYERIGIIAGRIRFEEILKTEFLDMVG